MPADCAGSRRISPLGISRYKAKLRAKTHVGTTMRAATIRTDIRCALPSRSAVSQWHGRRSRSGRRGENSHDIKGSTERLELHRMNQVAEPSERIAPKRHCCAQRLWN